MNTGQPFPFHLHEVDRLSQSAADVFERAFHGRPPEAPRHFVATLAREGADSVAAYVHFRAFEPSVYLVGGLCVDTPIYRKLTPKERSLVAGYGSLSRWLLRAATVELGAKRAVFAYTGDLRSRRDVLALGYVAPRSGLPWFSRARKYLLVQWHDEPEADRSALVKRVAAIGPF